MALGKSIKMYLTIFLATTCIYMMLYQYHISVHSNLQPNDMIKKTHKTSVTSSASASASASPSSSSSASIDSDSSASTFSFLQRYGLFLWTPLNVLSQSTVQKHTQKESDTLEVTTSVIKGDRDEKQMAIASQTQSAQAVHEQRHSRELDDISTMSSIGNKESTMMSMTATTLLSSTNVSTRMIYPLMVPSLSAQHLELLPQQQQFPKHSQRKLTAQLSVQAITIRSSTDTTTASTTSRAPIVSNKLHHLLGRNDQRKVIASPSNLRSAKSFDTSVTFGSSDYITNTSTTDALPLNGTKYNHTNGNGVSSSSSLLSVSLGSLLSPSSSLSTSSSSSPAIIAANATTQSHPTRMSSYVAINLPPLYVITPTYRRPEQLAELTRLGYTLKHISNLLWLVIEDANHTSPLVAQTLNRIGVPYEYLIAPMPVEYKNTKKAKPRGVSNRNRGLQWLRQNATDGVFYFADDDNTYDITIFEQMRYTQKVSMWPVGLVTKLGVSSPIVRNGKLDGFYDGWIGGRKYPVDMAGFAVSVKFLHARPKAKMPFKAGYEEDGFLRSLAPLSNADIELLASNCTEILTWHTQTKKNPLAAPLNMTIYGTTNLVHIHKYLLRP